MQDWKLKLIKECHSTVALNANLLENVMLTPEQSCICSDKELLAIVFGH